MKGFERKPNDIKKNIIEASGDSAKAREYLQNAGRKGARTREKNKILDEYSKSLSYDEYYKTELERLMSSEGELKTEEELVAEAEKLATSLVNRDIRNKMQNKEKEFLSKKALRQN